MFNPEATLRLLKGRFWGAKAMERRVKRCCDDNPECPFPDECMALYDAVIISEGPPVKALIGDKHG